MLPPLTTPRLRVLGLGGFERGVQAIANQPRWWRVRVALTSGPVEELLYQGHAVERLGTLTGRLPLGGLLAAAAFALAHTAFWRLGPALPRVCASACSWSLPPGDTTCLQSQLLTPGCCSWGSLRFRSWGPDPPRRVLRQPDRPSKASTALIASGFNYQRLASKFRSRSAVSTGQRDRPHFEVPGAFVHRSNLADHETMRARSPTL